MSDEIARPNAGTARTLTGIEMLNHFVEKCRDVGIRKIAGQTTVSKSSLARHLHDPGKIPLGEFLEISQVIGAVPQLVVVPLPEVDLAARRRVKRQPPAPPTTQGQNS